MNAGNDAQLNAPVTTAGVVVFGAICVYHIDIVWDLEFYNATRQG